MEQCRYKSRAMPITTMAGRECIAATALEHNETVVSRKTADFARTRFRLLNPWD